MADGSLSFADPLAARADTLLARHGGLDGRDLIAAAAAEFPGRLALVSSFGAEAAVLLHLVAQVDRAIPVLFLETGKHFGETLAYRRALAEHLGLRDVRDVRPDPADLARHDPEGDLARRDPDACCAIRKTWPLAEALDGFDAWITGRKRYQADTRDALPAIEAAEGRIKVNPLAAWSAAMIDEHYVLNGLPRHPLYYQNYLSIGCAPCTRAVLPGEDVRAGRWSDTDKTECGMHALQAAE